MPVTGLLYLFLTFIMYPLFNNSADYTASDVKMISKR